MAADNQLSQKRFPGLCTRQVSIFSAAVIRVAETRIALLFDLPGCPLAPRA